MLLRALIFVCVFFFLASCDNRPLVQNISETENEKFLSLLYEVYQGYELPVPTFDINDLGKNSILDYNDYGKFQNIGTPHYHYLLEKKEELMKDIGAGIYPNQRGVLFEEGYKKYREEGLLGGYYWDVLNTNDLKKAFYVWSQADENDGVKTFFTAAILEKAGHILPAIKAYYAALVHFPRTPCWASDKSFFWYIGPAAIKNIERLCRDYPELNLTLVEAQVVIKNGNDMDLESDIISVNPGKIIKKTLDEKLRELPDLNAHRVVVRRGKGKVQVAEYSNGHWQLRVDGKPFFIKGISYAPTEIGLGPHKDPLFINRWMFTDTNKNGLIDAPYESWVDKNKNSRQDNDEPSVGDFQLMKDMGINAIRLSISNNPKSQYDPSLVNKPLLRDLYRRFGIRVIVLDFLGAYTVGSNASWEEGTDYTDPEQRRLMKEAVRAKVLDLKDEPFVLMWLLGNENNMRADYMGINAARTNASVYPKEYAQFLNEVAKMIHELDPEHLVAVGNIELDLLDYYAQYAHEIDILGINSYRGKSGFGNLWEVAKEKFDRPMLITEYGCDAYYQGKGIDEEGQLQYHAGNLRDIIIHQAGGPSVGNAIGGIIFEFIDEWWKDTTGNPEDKQQTDFQFRTPFPDGFDHEEWLGIVSQGSGKNSPFERRLRKSYYYYKEMWGGGN